MQANDRIPDESAWYGYEDDIDTKWLHGLFYGKSNAEVQGYFGGGSSIERMDELLHAPRAVFQYYVHAFAAFVMSDQARADPDSAGPFLDLLVTREERDPGSVTEIYSSLAGCVDFVANNQAHFDADLDIYGDFKAKADHVRKQCDA